MVNPYLMYGFGKINSGWHKRDRWKVAGSHKMKKIDKWSSVEIGNRLTGKPSFIQFMIISLSMAAIIQKMFYIYLKSLCTSE